MSKTDNNDPSRLVDILGKFDIYNKRYADLTKGIYESIEEIRGKYDPRYGVSVPYLADLHLRLAPDERIEDPFVLRLSEGQRFYPTELEGRVNLFWPSETLISPHQLNKLVRDARDMEQVYLAPLVPDQRVDDKLPMLRLDYNIGLGNDLPSEFFELVVNDNGRIYQRVWVSDDMHPDKVKDGSGFIYRLNRTLTAFDNTESGLYIKPGEVRLELLGNALNFLREQIRQVEQKRNT